MAKWTIQAGERRFTGPGPGGCDVDHGVKVSIQSPHDQRKVAVWYASKTSTKIRPHEAVMQYLDDDEPPAHLLVTGKDVSVIDAA